MKLLLLLFGMLLWHLQAGLAHSESEEWEEQKPLKLANLENTVHNYNIYDQCHAQPGYPMAYFFQIVFHLQKHNFCGEKGQLMCYPGQLNNASMHQGLFSAVEYRLRSSKKNNEVAWRCEEQRQKCLRDKKCREWAMGGKGQATSKWHGILVEADHENVTIQLSTTNHIFVVPRNKFDEVLTIKLASSKHVVSFFSNSVGPLREPGNPRDHMELAEKRSRIYVPEDWKLWKAYDENRHRGMPMLRKAGIWSLGLDILPLEGIEQIKLFVERSKCCKMDTWFMLPTSQPPAMESIKPRDDIELIKSEVLIGKGMNLKLEGRFKDAAVVVDFVLVNYFQDNINGEKLFGARLNIVFDAIGVGKVTNVKDQEWEETADFGAQFSRGGFFILEFGFAESGLQIELNCQKQKEVKFIKPMIHEDLYMLKVMDGNGQIAKESLQLYNNESSNHEQVRSWILQVQKGSGVLFNGTVSEDGKDFTVCLRRIEGPKLFLCFVVDLGEMKYILKSDFKEKEEISYKDNAEIAIDAGKSVRLFIHFTEHGDEFRVWIAHNDSGSEIWAHIVDHKLNVPDELAVEKRMVDFVQLLGNFEKDGSILPPFMPAKLPHEEITNMTVYLTKTFEIVGIVLPPKNDITICFYSILNLGLGFDDMDIPIICFHMDFDDELCFVTYDESARAGEPKILSVALGYSPLEVNDHFVIHIRIFQEEIEGRGNTLFWKYELIVNNKRYSNLIKRATQHMDSIRKIKVDGNILLLQEPKFI